MSGDLTPLEHGAAAWPSERSMRRIVLFAALGALGLLLCIVLLQMLGGENRFGTLVEDSGNWAYPAVFFLVSATRSAHCCRVRRRSTLPRPSPPVATCSCRWSCWPARLEPSWVTPRCTGSSGSIADVSSLVSTRRCSVRASRPPSG